MKRRNATQGQAEARLPQVPGELFDSNQIEEMIKPLRSRKGQAADSFDERLINQWQLLADAAPNPSPELLGTTQGGQQVEWSKTLGALEQVAFDAARQLFEIDEDFAKLFDREQDLHKRVLNLSFSGAATSLLG